MIVDWMFKLIVLYTCIYIFNICLIFENIDASDVFFVIVPPKNDEHVAYFLMRCTQIKSRLVWPYVDGEFTYQVGDLVVMRHFLTKWEDKVTILFTEISCLNIYLVSTVIWWWQLRYISLKSRWRGVNQRDGRCQYLTMIILWRRAFL